MTLRCESVLDGVLPGRVLEPVRCERRSGHLGLHTGREPDGRSWSWSSYPVRVRERTMQARFSADTVTVER